MIYLIIYLLAVYGKTGPELLTYFSCQSTWPSGLLKKER